MHLPHQELAQYLYNKLKHLHILGLQLLLWMFWNPPLLWDGYSTSTDPHQSGDAIFNTAVESISVNMGIW